MPGLDLAYIPHSNMFLIGYPGTTGPIYQFLFPGD